LARLRRESVDRLMTMSRRTYSSTNPGTLHDQVVHESERIEDMAAALLGEFVPGGVLIVGLAILLASLDLGITLVTFAFAPVIYLTSRLLGRWVMGRIEVYHGKFERFSQGILSLLRAMDLIRIQSAEEIETEVQDHGIEELRVASARRTVGVTIYFVTQQGLVAMVGAAVLIFGGVSVIHGSMSLGDLISFYAAFAMLRGPLSTLALRAPEVIEGLQSLEHLHELLAVGDQRPYVGTRKIDFVGAVRLEDVSFGYDERTVLHGISLALEPGKMLGLIGPNGSGKSTIVNLILGFYRPDEGAVSADGLAYDTLEIPVLRRFMGVVPQQPLLRSASVLENVLYGHGDASPDAIRQALEVTGADRFIADLADGIDTQIGEDGVFLSGGQRQRLAIARALVHHPRLLILDEPTNHLDRDSVSQIVANLQLVLPDASILVVSHRDEVLRGVDQLIELNEGRIIGSYLSN